MFIGPAFLPQLTICEYPCHAICSSNFRISICPKTELVPPTKSVPHWKMEPASCPHYLNFAQLLDRPAYLWIKVCLKQGRGNKFVRTWPAGQNALPRSYSDFLTNHTTARWLLFPLPMYYPRSCLYCHIAAHLFSLLFIKVFWAAALIPGSHRLWRSTPFPCIFCLQPSTGCKLKFEHFLLYWVKECLMLCLGRYA